MMSAWKLKIGIQEADDVTDLNLVWVLKYGDSNEMEEKITHGTQHPLKN